MGYSAQTWTDSPSTATPLSAARMTVIENGIVASEQVALSTKTANYTLVLTDAALCIEMNSSSATTLTIPTNASVAFPIGTIIQVYRMGTGTVTIAGSGGVTVRSPSALTLSAQYATVTLRKRATNEWVASGHLT